MRYIPSLKTQSCIRSTLKFENLSIRLGIWNTQLILQDFYFYFFKLYLVQCFSADPRIFLKKIFFLLLKRWKNRALKLIIGPDLIFSTDPAAQTAQKQKPRTTKSPLMQDWVFRLEIHTNLLFVFIYIFLVVWQPSSVWPKVGSRQDKEKCIKSQNYSNFPET